MQMIDLHQATITLNAYSTSINVRTTMRHPDAHEESMKIEKRLAELASEKKEALIIVTLIMERVTKHSEQLVVAFTGELAELLEAIDRVMVAVAEANRVELAHKEKTQRMEPTESSSAKAIREFLASRVANRTQAT